MSNQSSISLQRSEPKNYTRVPNIVFDLPLDAYEFRLYLFYRSVASNSNGTSWYSNAKLAEKCQMSKRKLIQCKKRLAQPFDLLSGKPLIIVEKRVTEVGDEDSSLIIIVDIWDENNKENDNKTQGHALNARPVVQDLHPNYTNINNSAAPAPSLQEPPTPEPQVSQAREEALKQLTLDARALNNARSSEHTDETVINAVARVLEYGKSANPNAMLKVAIEEKWKPKETPAIKPQKKDFEADLSLRLKEIGANATSCSAVATALTSAYPPCLINRGLLHFECNPNDLKDIKTSVEDCILSYMEKMYGKYKK